MPAADSPAVIVARFLKTNNYIETLETFLSEAGLPADSGSVSKGDLTLETLLEEKKTFDLSVRFEKLGVEDGNTGWKSPSPEIPSIIKTLPSSSNLLNVTLTHLKDDNQDPHKLLLATAADRRLHILETPTCTLRESVFGVQDSPILSCAVVANRYLLTTSMSGQLVLSTSSGKLIDKRKDHTKYVIKVVVWESENDIWIATAGWDSKVKVYRTSATPTGMNIGEPVATIILPSNPEALTFLKHAESSDPVLLVSRRDSTFLYYYTLDAEPRMFGRQNLAPHSNAWIAFTPSDMALCPTDPSLLAVATSAVPHMKLIIVRLLVPSLSAEVNNLPPPLDVIQPLRASILDGPATETQASQARAALALAERESAAILIHCTTLAPQTAYSTPALAWRPDGSGVWVNSDDGVIRGIEASSGKIVSTLKGHEVGSKVRCLLAGWVERESVKEEWLVSGGFDQKLIVWKPAV